MLTNIYVLLDPRKKGLSGIRYVGKTDCLRVRLRQHLNETKKGSSLPLYNWIRKLLEIGLIPEIKGIEQVPKSNWQKREIYWIGKWRKFNPDILNVSDGGDGGNLFEGHKHTEKSKALIGENNISKNPKWRERQSEIMKGENNPFFGRVHTEEFKKKLSNSRKGHKNPKSKRVIKLDFNGVELDRFNTVKLAADSVKLRHSGDIGFACRNGVKRGGFYWKYAA